MGAGFDYLTFLHHDDQIGTADGGEAVGDDDGRFVLSEVGECLLDEAFTFGVESGGEVTADCGRCRPRRPNPQKPAATNVYQPSLTNYLAKKAVRQLSYRTACFIVYQLLLRRCVFCLFVGGQDASGGFFFFGTECPVGLH